MRRNLSSLFLSLGERIKVRGKVPYSLFLSTD
jgi:hypothetical protein